MTTAPPVGEGGIFRALGQSLNGHAQDIGGIGVYIGVASR